MMDSAAWDRAYGAADIEWAVEPHPLAAAELSGLPAGHAVELGCGEGRQAMWLAGRGWRATAVDFSPVAIDRGRRIAERHELGVDWVVADVRSYRPPEVDLALILYLHIDGFAEVIAGAAAALRPGGTLFVLGWDRENVTGPAPRYSVAELTAAAGGLAVIRAERVRQAGSANAWDTLLVARNSGEMEMGAPGPRRKI